MRRFWFWAVLAVGVALRLYGLTNPLLDNHAWRQADTASMAANFLQYGFFPLVPQLNYDGPAPNYVELEFPVIPLLTAAVWKVFGQSDLSARLVVVLFSGVSLALFYFLGRALYDRSSGLLAMAFFAFNPLGIYYGRTVMPEPAMLCFSLGAVCLLVRWYQTGSLVTFCLAALCFALAVLAKLPDLLLVVPFLALGVQRYKHKVFSSREFWLFLAIGLLPPALYYYLAHLEAKTRYVSGIVQSQVFAPANLEYLRKTLEGKLTAPLGITALFAPFVRRTAVGNAFIWAWLAVLALYTFTVGARIQLEYYFYPLLPALCVLAGGTLGKFWGEAPGVVSGVLILLLCINSSYYGLKDYYLVNSGVLRQAQVIAAYTGPDDLLILSDAPPMTFYYSNRKGWRLGPETQTPQDLEEYHRLGGKVFVVLPGFRLKPGLHSYLQANYAFVPEGNFYDLSGRPAAEGNR